MSISQHELLIFIVTLKMEFTLDNNLFQYFNITSQKVHGIEFEAKIIPVKNLNVTANYTNLKPNETIPKQGNI